MGRMPGKGKAEKDLEKMHAKKEGKDKQARDWTREHWNTFFGRRYAKKGEGTVAKLRRILENREGRSLKEREEQVRGLGQVETPGEGSMSTKAVDVLNNQGRRTAKRQQRMFQAPQGEALSLREEQDILLGMKEAEDAEEPGSSDEETKLRTMKIHSYEKDQEEWEKEMATREAEAEAEARDEAKPGVNSTKSEDERMTTEEKDERGRRSGLPDDRGGGAGEQQETQLGVGDE